MFPPSYRRKPVFSLSDKRFIGKILVIVLFFTMWNLQKKIRNVKLKIFHEQRRNFSGKYFEIQHKNFAHYANFSHHPTMIYVMYKIYRNYVPRYSAKFQIKLVEFVNIFREILKTNIMTILLRAGICFAHSRFS